MALPAVIFLAISCAQLALLPVTPLLSIALSSRGGDDRTSRQIAELEQKQDWAGLAQFARQRLQEPQNAGEPDWWVVLGYAQVRQGSYKLASESFAQAVERSPEDIDARNMLGESQRLAGQPAMAVRTLERATAIDPTSHVTRYLLGEAYRDDDRLERAKNAYRDALGLDARFGPAWFGLGTVLVRTGSTDELREVHEKLKKLDPSLDAELAKIQAAKIQAGNR